MAVGPGKYDDLATAVRSAAVARGVIVVVFGGNRGSGFSVQADGPTTLQLPKILRDLADQIDADLTKGKL
jgi:subtilisin family serine protease